MNKIAAWLLGVDERMEICPVCCLHIETKIESADDFGAKFCGWLAMLVQHR